jgi:ABC-type transport system substrate-binding protein
VFRNFPGDDPDANYVWWYGKGSDGTGTNLVNFNGFDDAEINRNLDEGRTNPDAAARKKAYEAITRRFADQAYNIWLWDVVWAVAERPNVHGVLGPPLPGDDPSQPGETSTSDPNRQPTPGLATGHSLLGLWVEKG